MITKIQQNASSFYEAAFFKFKILKIMIGILFFMSNAVAGNDHIKKYEKSIVRINVGDMEYGNGIVVSKNDSILYIVTCEHLFENMQSDTKIKISSVFLDNEFFAKYECCAKDWDLACLKVKGSINSLKSIDLDDFANESILVKMENKNIDILIHSDDFENITKYEGIFQKIDGDHVYHTINGIHSKMLKSLSGSLVINEMGKIVGIFKAEDEVKRLKSIQSRLVKKFIEGKKCKIRDEIKLSNTTGLNLHQVIAIKNFFNQKTFLEYNKGFSSDLFFTNQKTSHRYGFSFAWDWYQFPYRIGADEKIQFHRNSERTMVNSFTVGIRFYWFKKKKIKSFLNFSGGLFILTREDWQTIDATGHQYFKFVQDETDYKLGLKAGLAVEGPTGIKYFNWQFRIDYYSFYEGFSWNSSSLGLVINL